MQRMGYYRLFWCINLVSLVGRRPSAPPAIVLCPVRSSLDPSKCDRSASHQLPGPFPMCFLVFLFLWRFQVRAWWVPGLAPGLFFAKALVAVGFWAVNLEDSSQTWIEKSLWSLDGCFCSSPCFNSTQQERLDLWAEQVNLGVCHDDLRCSWGWWRVPSPFQCGFLFPNPFLPVGSPHCQNTWRTPIFS